MSGMSVYGVSWFLRWDGYRTRTNMSTTSWWNTIPNWRHCKKTVWQDRLDMNRFNSVTEVKDNIKVVAMDLISNATLIKRQSYWLAEFWAAQVHTAFWRGRTISERLNPNAGRLSVVVRDADGRSAPIPLLLAVLSLNSWRHFRSGHWGKPNSSGFCTYTFDLLSQNYSIPTSRILPHSASYHLTEQPCTP